MALNTPYDVRTDTNYVCVLLAAAGGSAVYVARSDSFAYTVAQGRRAVAEYRWSRLARQARHRQEEEAPF